MKFNANGKSYDFDYTSLTFNEGIELENLTGLSVTDLFPEIAKGKLAPQQALIYIAVKRAEPNVSFSDIGNWAIDSVEWLLPEDTDTKKDDQVADPSGTPTLSTPSETTI